MRFTLAFIFLITCHITHANMNFYVSGAVSLDIDRSNSITCPNRTSKQELEEMTKELILEYYPQLTDALMEDRLKIREFNDDQYYLKTFIKLGHLLKDKRVYFIDINKKLYECSPQKNALKAILAHELKHIQDYQKGNSVELLKLGLKMLKKKSRSEYERSTDYWVMELGLSEDLKEYRQWIYDQLTQKSLKTKKCFYYTPEELNRFLQGERDFSDYFNKYCK